MRRALPLSVLAILVAYLSGCGEAPSRPSVITDRPVTPPKTSARYIQVPWDISLFFNIPGGAIVAGGTTAATPGAAAEGDNLTGTYSNSTGFGGTLTGVLTGTLESGTFNGSLKTITASGCPAERQFTGPVTTGTLNWTPGNHLNDCGGSSPLTGQIQITAPAPNAPPPCTSYSATIGETSFAAAGGAGAVTVTAGAGCTWFATSSASFVTLSAAQGTANGTVQFTVAANTSAAARTATVVVANQSFTIAQAGVAGRACTYTLNDTGRTFGAAGALGGVDMRTASGCAWQAQSSAAWLTITGGSSGTGDGTISFAVAANPGLSQRVGQITAQGQIFTVTQSGVGCGFTVTPSQTAFPEAGGSGTVSIVTDAGCEWTARTQAPWITLTGAVSGTGNGTVPFSVARNTGIGRGGTMTIAGQVLTITQALASASTLSGTITNSLNGTPVSGATVSVGNQTATTAANGTYTLANVPIGGQTVRISAPQFVSRSDTVVHGYDTIHNVPLTPATPLVAVAFSTNPVFPDEEDRHCGQAENLWCWEFTYVLRESGGASLTVTTWEINLYDTEGGLFQHTAFTAADFARFHGGATGVTANGTTTGGAMVWFGSPSGGTIEILINGVDMFNRPHQFTSVPRLSAQERARSELRSAPRGRSTTAPPPRPRGGR